MTASQRFDLLSFNQKQRVKFLNELRKLIAGGDDGKKVSDFYMILATDDQIESTIILVKNLAPSQT